MMMVTEIKGFGKCGALIVHPFEPLRITERVMIKMCWYRS